MDGRIKRRLDRGWGHDDDMWRRVFIIRMGIEIKGCEKSGKECKI